MCIVLERNGKIVDRIPVSEENRLEELEKALASGYSAYVEEV